jgi:hypothetical protein
MKLPGRDRAQVDPAKVRDYLLSPDHAVGRSKARWFAGLGFSRANWPELQWALLEIARDGEAREGRPSPYGRKYEVRATLMRTRGRSAALVTVWIVSADDDFPRFVTAYPGE